MMANLLRCFPTMPSAMSREPLRIPLIDRRPRKTRRHRVSAVVDDDTLEALRLGPRLYPQGLDPPGDPGPGAPGELRDRSGVRDPGLGLTVVGASGQVRPLVPARRCGQEVGGHLLFDPRGHQKGDDGGIDVGELADHLDDLVGGLVVQEAPPGLPIGTARQQDADLGLAVGKLGRELERCPGESPIRAVDHIEGEPRQAEALPPVDERLCPGVVDVEMDRTEVVRGEAACILDGPRRSQVDPVDEDHHHVAAEDPLLASLDGGSLLQDGILGSVLGDWFEPGRRRSGA